MNTAIIEAITSVEHDGTVRVSLGGMRADLTNNIGIRPKEITEWAGTDSNGFSVLFAIRPGAAISFTGIDPRTRNLSGVSFVNP